MSQRSLRDEAIVVPETAEHGLAHEPSIVVRRDRVASVELGGRDCRDATDALVRSSSAIVANEGGGNSAQVVYLVREPSARFATLAK